ncbi:MAG: YdcF family protein [Oceanospirillaceae bacterium]|nr:YdcF family protein [Oceanospirillaceae bacterium]
MDYFYVISKLFWFLVSPDHFLILLMVLSAILINCRSKWGMRLLISSLCASLLILFLPVADILLRPLEKRFPAPTHIVADVRGIIVLGGAERGGLSSRWKMAQFNGAAERMMAIPVLARAYPNAKIVFTGGSGSLLHPEDVADSAMQTWFNEQGVTGRVLWEKESRNTFENAVLSEKLLAGVPRGRWLLVTSAFHMPRSMGIFRARGWDVVAYPVDYYSKTADGLRLDPKYWQHVRDLNIAVKEWIGLVVYYYTDKTDALFPAPKSKI